MKPRKTGTGLGGKIVEILVRELGKNAFLAIAKTSESSLLRYYEGGGNVQLQQILTCCDAAKLTIETVAARARANLNESPHAGLAEHQLSFLAGADQATDQLLNLTDDLLEELDWHTRSPEATRRAVRALRIIRRTATQQPNDGPPAR